MQSSIKEGMSFVELSIRFIIFLVIIKSVLIPEAETVNSFWFNVDHFAIVLCSSLALDLLYLVTCKVIGGKLLSNLLIVIINVWAWAKRPFFVTIYSLLNLLFKFKNKKYCNTKALIISIRIYLLLYFVFNIFISKLFNRLSMVE